MVLCSDHRVCYDNILVLEVVLLLCTHGDVIQGPSHGVRVPPLKEITTVNSIVLLIQFVIFHLDIIEMLSWQDFIKCYMPFSELIHTCKLFLQFR